MRDGVLLEQPPSSCMVAQPEARAFEQTNIDVWLQTEFLAAADHMPNDIHNTEETTTGQDYRSVFTRGT